MERLTRRQAEDFLYQEARLLDERRLEEWLELFTSNGLYWIPIDENSDPEKEPSILYDDAATRAQRVYQLLHQPHWSQMPPSRTQHMISNVEVADGETPETAVVRCSVAVFELRPGDPRQFGRGDERFFAGRCDYQLHYQNGWRIAFKKLVLINRDLPIPSLSFIL
jgi:3-phenylpropionate/cinnamic acid dioxygenase small subunit